ncbi:MAG: DUF3873 domain-containing protein [Faecalibacterium sp.]|nr:DUF3873 domain-containing protein [Faecalibacterium sp.]
MKKVTGRWPFSRKWEENEMNGARYCSIRGKLFNCTCCTKDEAQRLCEDWLIKQDRCYIN